MSYSLVIVDDHTLLSQAIGAMVDNFDQFSVLYHCKNGEEMIQKFSDFPKNISDFVLRDINMPIMNGIETTQWVSENHPNVNLMALSVEEADLTTLKTLKAGAVGCLLKETEKKVLEHALTEVAENGFFHTKNVTNLLLQSISGVGKATVELKENKLTFMKLACTEMTYKEIADRMCLSPKTIDGYCNVLFTKTKCKESSRIGDIQIKNKIYTPKK